MKVVHDKDNNIILLVTQVVTITNRLDGRNDKRHRGIRVELRIKGPHFTLPLQLPPLTSPSLFVCPNLLCKYPHKSSRRTHTQDWRPGVMNFILWPQDQ